MLRKIAMPILILSVALAACGSIGDQPLGQIGQQASVEGEVISVDLSPMMVDGPAEIEIVSQEHGQVTVLVPPCFPDCSQQAVEQLEVIEPGQRWRAVGEVAEADTLVLYQDGRHSLNLMEN